MTLLEVSVASAIFAVLLSISVQMLRAVSNQQRAAERRVVAMEAVQAITEQLGNLPWDELTPQAASDAAIPPPHAQFLPNAAIAVTIDNETEPTLAKRIRVELTWTGAGGQPSRPVRLTSWAFAESEAPDEPSP